MRTTEGIFCVGVDHHATALAEREALVSLAGERLTPHLIEHNGAEEVVFLSTCNRVEIYGVSGRRGPEIAEALGWGSDDRVMKVKIFGKDGEKIWMRKDVESPAPLTAKMKELLGPAAPTPPNAEPKKSKILLRRG
ncbi:MAG: Glutamyl-tRNAGlu reductase, N-terminal domain [Verrucomicrobiota bacterium]